MTEMVERELILVIAQIAGYTKFMLQGATALDHAEVNITCLLEAVLADAKLPWVVARLEGDSILMYAVRRNGTVWQSDREVLRKRLARFHESFYRRLALLQATNTCECGACAFLDQLAIGIVVHAGHAVVRRFNGVDVLSGPDVRHGQILAQDCVMDAGYLLVTAAAFEQLGMDDGPGIFALKVEQHDGLAPVTVLVDRQLAQRGPIAAAGLAAKAGIMARQIGSILRLWAAFRGSGRQFGLLPSHYSVPKRYE